VSTACYSRPARDEKSQSDRRAYIHLLIDQLLQLEASTDPRDGATSATRKDLKAYRALRYAGDLVQNLAGWAINHQIGLALEGRRFVASWPSGALTSSRYLAEVAAVDDHRHEVAGARAARQQQDPKTDRRIFANLLQGNPGAFPRSLMMQVNKDLHALDFGESRPLFRKANRRRKVSLDELELQLQAVEFVSYRRAQGRPKHATAEEVAAAFGIAPETLLSWEKRLAREFGAPAIKRRVIFARNAGLAKRKADDDDTAFEEALYGDDALSEAAATYKSLKRRRKAIKQK